MKKFFAKKFAFLLLLLLMLIPILGYSYEESLIGLEPNFYKKMTETGTLVSLTLSEKMNLRMGSGTVFRFRILMPPGVRSMFVNTESNDWLIGGGDNPRFGLFETDPGPMEHPTFAELPTVGTSGLGLMLQRNQIPIDQATNTYFIGYNPSTIPFTFGSFSVMMSVEDVSLYDAWYNARQVNGLNYEGIGESFSADSQEDTIPDSNDRGKSAFIFDGINFSTTQTTVLYNDEGTIPETLEIIYNQTPVTLKSTIYFDPVDISKDNRFIVAAIWGNTHATYCLDTIGVDGKLQFKTRNFFQTWTKLGNLPSNFSDYPVYIRELSNTQSVTINIGENALITPPDGFGFSTLCFFTGYLTPENKIIGEFSDVFSLKQY